MNRTLSDINPSADTTPKAIILDWAGTTIDFGSFAPIAAFIKAFDTAAKLTPTMDETRAPMGMKKWDHIKTMLESERLDKAFREVHGRSWSEDDVDAIHTVFKESLFEVLPDYTTLLPNVAEVIKTLKANNVLIGSTTGYSSEMMKIVMPLVGEQGYEPDCVVTPDEVSGYGRPYPYMVWENLKRLEVLDVRGVAKIGDTLADIEEANNAGCVSVGIVKGSNVLGWDEQEWDAASEDERNEAIKQTTATYEAAGADAVLRDITQLPAFLGL